jgi:hypothetical protein
MKKSIMTVLRDYIIADSIGRTKDDCIVIRTGFYYTHGRTAEQHRDGIIADLKSMSAVKNIPEFEVVDYGEVWRDFRGGASIANSSHWFVKIKEVKP